MILIILTILISNPNIRNGALPRWELFGQRSLQLHTCSLKHWGEHWSLYLFVCLYLFLSSQTLGWALYLFICFILSLSSQILGWALYLFVFCICICPFKHWGRHCIYLNLSFVHILIKLQKELEFTKYFFCLSPQFQSTSPGRPGLEGFP